MSARTPAFSDWGRAMDATEVQTHAQASSSSRHTAPTDHFNPAWARLTELSEELARLRKTFDSKEAHARIDISAQGYQYNWKARNSTNVLDLDGQNINDNDRFDGWRTTYYSDLLGGGDTAYLLVSSSFYVYARWWFLR